MGFLNPAPRCYFWSHPVPANIFKRIRSDYSPRHFLTFELFNDFAVLKMPTNTKVYLSLSKVVPSCSFFRIGRSLAISHVAVLSRTPISKWSTSRCVIPHPVLKMFLVCRHYSTGNTKRWYLNALANRATVSFIELHSTYKITLR